MLKSLPRQTAEIYRTIRHNKTLTAQQISEQLGIMTNAVYRNIHHLKALGLIEILPGYPMRYAVKPDTAALETYRAIAQQGLQQALGLGANTSKSRTNELLQLTFLNSRKERLRHIIKDTQQARQSINLIASGLEVPGEMILAYKRAIDRGVKIRIIVQNLDEVREAMFRNWQKIGVEVRYFPNLEARIYIFDKRILYLNSYHPHDKQEGVGVRFAYAPCAKLIDELFERRWQSSKPIVR